MQYLYDPDFGSLTPTTKVLEGHRDVFVFDPENGGHDVEEFAARYPHVIYFEIDTEKLYLQCEHCGEVFDSIETANQHDEAGVPTSFYILPESEAL